MPGPPYTSFAYGDPAAQVWGSLGPLGQVQPSGNAVFIAFPLITTGTLIVPWAQVLQGGTVGTAYSETVQAGGGYLPFTFTVSAGTLPAGLGPINSSTGVISGTPTTPGTSTFTVRATDSHGNYGETSFQITIVAAASAGGSWASVC